MQIMFFRHHFGQLAIGLSNADVALRISRQLFHEYHREHEHDFLAINANGVEHPWSRRDRAKKDDFSVRVAIVGDHLYFDEQDYHSDNTRLFAKVECNVNCEVYLAYRHPGSLIGQGLPDPAQMAATIIQIAVDHVNGKPVHPHSYPKWIVVDKKQVPVKFRSLLGKVILRVKEAIGQGADFFRDPKFK